MIYVLSDIHGHEDRFNSILRQIHLHILGDVIDRGPSGIRLLRNIARLNNMAVFYNSKLIKNWIIAEKQREKILADRHRIQSRIWIFLCELCRNILIQSIEGCTLIL